MDDRLTEILNKIGIETNVRRDERLKRLDMQREFEVEIAQAYYDGAYRALECVEKLLQSKNNEITALKTEFQYLRKKHKDEHDE